MKVRPLRGKSSPLLARRFVSGASCGATLSCQLFQFRVAGALTIPYPLSPIPYPLSPIPYPLSPIPYPLSPIPCPLSVGRHLDDTITQEGIDYIEERCPGFNRRRADEDTEVSA